MKKILSIFVFCLLRLSSTQIPRRALAVRDLLTMQRGLGWPHDLQVAEGHEAMLKIATGTERPDSCVITTPDGQQFHVESPPSNRFERWSDSCGVRIHRVVSSDTGRWRITATKGNTNVTGWTEITVNKAPTSYTGPEIALLDGQTHEVDLASLDNSYCLVTQPFSESSLIPGHCRVKLDKVTRAVQGNWNVLLGLPGQVAELQVQRRVAVQAERLETGYVRDSTTNKLHIYCNIQHTVKNITFCRFQKISHDSGFNVIDGLSDGSHSYYGKGFLHRECGMTIERPTVHDSGAWRCSVGVQQWVGTQIQQQPPLQALISVGADTRSTAMRIEEEEISTVFVQEHNTFTVMCRAQVSLTYCWFQHPNGTQFTPVPLVDEEQAFWYTGENLQVGDCGITFSEATPEEQGIWTCHMGPDNSVGVEITDKIEVRVTGPLAANKKEIATSIGDSVTLYCHTSNGNRPLEYCRFLSPSFLGFRIDASVTEENAILDRYYFTPGRDLDYGDCSLTIKSIEEKDIGEWTCAALINNESLESRDTIDVILNASSRRPLSRAGIVGMSMGLLILVGVLIGVTMYKKGWYPRFSFSRRNVPTSQRDVISNSETVRSSISSSSASTGSEVTVGRNGDGEVVCSYTRS